LTCCGASSGGGGNQSGTYYGLRDFARQYLAASYCARAVPVSCGNKTAGNHAKAAAINGIRSGGLPSEMAFIIKKYLDNLKRLILND